HLDHAVHDLGLHHGLDLDPRPQRDVHLGAAVALRVATLGPAALDLGHREAGHPALVEDVLDLLELLVADDGNDHLHAGTSLGCVARASPSACGLTVGKPTGR